MNKISRFMAAAISISMTAGLLMSCGSSATKGSTTASTNQSSAVEGETDSTTAAALDLSKEVELSLYVVSDRPAGQDVLDENLNKLLKEKMNTTLKTEWIAWSEYANKYPLLFSSGEVFDMAYAATWLNFAALARKGAFKSLDELWPTYAPKNFARQSETALQQATVDGHYYCVPTLLATYSAYGPIYRTDILEGTDWDGKMETIADYETYLQYVKDNTTLEPYDVYSSGSEMDDIFMYNNGLYALKGSTNDFLWIDPAEENPKIFTYYEYDKTADFLEMMNRWNQAGYFPKSALSDTDSSKVQNGVAASTLHNIDTYQSRFIEHPEWGFKFANFVSDVSNMSFTQDAMVISNTSENPERALALYDLITNDEEVYRAFMWGIEGTSYEIKDDQLSMLDLTTYPGSSMWAARTTEFNLPTYGSPADLQTWKDSFDQAIVDGEGSQKYRSFVLDISSIETEYAACQNVHQQYWWPLELGYTDPVSGLQEYKDKMEAAGIEKVIETLQTQLNDYLTAQKG